MTHHLHRWRRVLAIHPTKAGFGYAVVEGNRHLVDWKVAAIVGARCTERQLARIRLLVRRYGAAEIIVEDCKARSCQRRAGTRAFIARIERLDWGSTNVRRMSSSAMRQELAGHPRASQAKVAAAVADRFPVLAPALPPKRRAWMSQHWRTAVFCAVGLAVAWAEANRDGVP